MKSPSRYNETSVQRTDFASPLALRYVEVPLYTEANLGPVYMEVGDPR